MKTLLTIMIFKNEFLYNYLKEAPLPLAIERTFECIILSKNEFTHPILDIGCGEGIFSYILFDEKIDIGIDPNIKELERASKYGMYAELINCYGDKIDKPDKFFKTIFSNSVLEHIQDINPVLRTAYRLLDDDGVFYCTVPTNYFDKYSLIFQTLTFLHLKRLSEKFRVFFNKFWRHYHYYDIEGWTRLFNDNGFVVENSIGYCSKKFCLLNDALSYFSIYSLIIKKITNKWYLFKICRVLPAKFFNSLLKNRIKVDNSISNCGIVFFKLTKKRDSSS